MGLELVIEPRPRDLGDGFVVRRSLPHAKRRHVGPFVFLDEMGPVDFAPGQGLDVRPHPHVNLATITWLFEGEITHRDTTGAHQSIRPGDVNWMTAGCGVAHSERTGADVRAAGHRLHGVQAWIALPVEHEEIAPSFQHHPAESLPRIVAPGVAGVLIAGRLDALTSPVVTLSDLTYAALDLAPNASFVAPAAIAERAVYLVSGAVTIDGQAITPGELGVFGPGPGVVETRERSRLMLMGGAPLGPRTMFWNFISSRPERVDQAKRDWSASAELGFRKTPFALPEGEDEFIPLPGDWRHPAEKPLD